TGSSSGGVADHEDGPVIAYRYTASEVVSTDVGGGDAALAEIPVEFAICSQSADGDVAVRAVACVSRENHMTGRSHRHTSEEVDSIADRKASDSLVSEAGVQSPVAVVPQNHEVARHVETVSTDQDAPLSVDRNVVRTVGYAPGIVDGETVSREAGVEAPGGKNHRRHQVASGFSCHCEGTVPGDGDRIGELDITEIQCHTSVGGEVGIELAI